MSAGQAGYLLGVFLAAGGAGYIWLAILMGVRVYKRWPRFSVWSAVVVVLFIGGVTAMAGSDEGLTALGTVAAAAFIIWRERKHLTPAAPPPDAPRH